jgi:hypothetical protein
MTVDATCASNELGEIASSSVKASVGVKEWATFASAKNQSRSVELLDFLDRPCSVFSRPSNGICKCVE